MSVSLRHQSPEPHDDEVGLIATTTHTSAHPSSSEHHHDANTAEVICYQDERRIRVLYQEDELPRYYPDEKEQVNLFLAEWLALCLEAGQGHHALRPTPVAPCA